MPVLAKEAPLEFSRISQGNFKTLNSFHCGLVVSVESVWSSVLALPEPLSAFESNCLPELPGWALM